MKDSLRMTRINELIRREVADLIEKFVERERGVLISVTEVNTTADLKSSKVYISILGNQKQKRTQMKNIEKHRVSFQSAIASHIKIKYTPVLEFILDNRLEAGDKVLSIIDELDLDP